MPSASPSKEISRRSPSNFACAAVTLKSPRKLRVPSGWLGGKSKNWSNPPRRLPVDARYSGWARLITILPFTAIDVISGLAGSSENCALQGRSALSFQLTRAESEVALTVIEPGPPVPISKGTTTARAVNAAESRTRVDFILTPLLEFQPARTLPAESRAWRRAQLQHQLHHHFLDNVPNLAVFSIFHEHRIRHFPIHNTPPDFLRTHATGSIDHDAEIRPP